MQVSMSQFKSYLAHYIQEAQSGKLIEVTSHRKVVARLVGVVEPDDTATSRLLAAGVASWQGGKPTGGKLALGARGSLVSKMVLEDRA